MEKSGLLKKLNISKSIWKGNDFKNISCTGSVTSQVTKFVKVPFTLKSCCAHFYMVELLRDFFILMRDFLWSGVGEKRRGTCRGGASCHVLQGRLSPPQFLLNSITFMLRNYYFLFLNMPHPPPTPPKKRKNKLLMSSSTTGTCLAGRFIIGSRPRMDWSLGLCNLISENVIAYSSRVWILC